MNRRLRIVVTCLAASAAAIPAVVVPAPAGTCPAPGAPGFSAPRYVDEARAGGEPMIHVHPDGTLLYGAHAGTTHFYAPEAGGEATPAFTGNYDGRTYFWWSADDGKTWTLADRPDSQNQDGSGFSDPEVAIDSGGTVYISEINLVNVAMSSSKDSGRTYGLQNFFAQTMTDRQWSEADGPGVVYLVGNAFAGGTGTTSAGHVGHYLYRSTDGGKTFTPGEPDMQRGYGRGDLRVDKRTGTLYEAHYENEPSAEHYQELSLAAFRKARSGDLTPQMHTIAKGVAMASHWSSIDVDGQGNVYVAWDEDGTGLSKRPAGIYYASSADEGRSWSAPIRVDHDDKTDIWPWLAVGDEGRVAIAWLQADVSLPDHDAEAEGTHGWNVYVAATTTGLGCDGSDRPGFAVVRATEEPMHRGTICMTGTACQALGIDRRLGDYFAIDIDTKGRMVAAYSDTRRGGAVALPAFLPQSSGPSFLAPKAVTPKPAPPKRPAAVKGTKTTPLPATGLGDGYTIWGLALLAGAAIFARRLSRAH